MSPWLGRESSGCASRGRPVLARGEEESVWHDGDHRSSGWWVVGQKCSEWIGLDGIGGQDAP